MEAGAGAAVDRARERLMEPGLSWRIVTDGALPGAANMARDHALAQALRPGMGTVRFYRWSPATLSLGRNEPFTPEYRDFLRLHPETGVVRRPTGGRAVIHDRELTYAVALPARAWGGPRRAYRKVNEGLVAGLRHLGVAAVTAAGRVLPPEAGPCFLEPAEGEVVVRGPQAGGEVRRRASAARFSSTVPYCWGRTKFRCWGVCRGTERPPPATATAAATVQPRLARLPWQRCWRRCPPGNGSLTRSAMDSPACWAEAGRGVP